MGSPFWWTLLLWKQLQNWKILTGFSCPWKLCPFHRLIFSSWQKLASQVKDWTFLEGCLCWSYSQWFYLQCPEMFDHDCATPQEASKDCAWWVGGTVERPAGTALFHVGDNKALCSWSGITFHKIRQPEEMLNTCTGHIFNGSGTTLSQQHQIQWIIQGLRGYKDWKMGPQKE